MATEYRLSYTATEIDEKLGKIDELSAKAMAHIEDFAADDDGVHGIKFTPDHKVRIKDEHEVWMTVINPYKTYTAVIDEEESDPDLAVSYADDAKDMEAKSEEWMETDIFKDVRPCVFRDGEVQCYLDPNDYTRQIKNTTPLFYLEDEIKLNGKCAYTEIIQAEEAALYDADGNSLPIGIENFNQDIGYIVQKGKGENYDRGTSTTVSYRGTGHMEYKFNVPYTGDYYWIIKFSCPVSNKIRQHEFSINDGQRQLITFPQKGNQWMSYNTSWNKNETKYVFQFMRQCISLDKGENSIKVYTPTDYWSETSTVSGIEIDFIALQSVDTPDITSGIDKEVLSSYYLKENKFPITTGGITTGTLENNSDCAAQVLSFKVIEAGNSDQEAKHAIDLGRDGSNPLMNKPINDYPYLRVYYDCFKAGTAAGAVGAYVYLKNGTITRVWGKKPPLISTGQSSYFDIDLRSDWTGGEMSSKGYTLDDVDFTKPLVGLQIKPWYNQVRNVDEYFNIIGLAFYAEKYYEDIVPSYFNGDVMIEIPKMGYRFNRVGTNLKVSVTRDPESPGFSYDAFVRGDKVNDYIYVGAYKSCLHNGTLRSLSNQDCSLGTDTLSVGAVRSMAESNNTTNSGYGILTYSAYNLIACLSLLYNKTLETGSTDYIEPDEMYTTSGTTNTRGMNYLDITKTGYKFIGIENIVNIYATSPESGCSCAILDGCKIREDNNIYIATKDFDNNNSWTKIGKYIDTTNAENNFYTTGSYKTVIGNNLLGFLGDEVGASSTTYYCYTGINSNGTISNGTYFVAPLSNRGLCCISLIDYYVHDSEVYDYKHNLHLMYSKEE